MLHHPLSSLESTTDSFRQPRQSYLDSPPHSLVSSSLSSSPLSSAITPHSSLYAQTYLFNKILPTLNFCTPRLPLRLWDWTGLIMLVDLFLVRFFCNFCFFLPCGRLSCLHVSFYCTLNAQYRIVSYRITGKHPDPNPEIWIRILDHFWLRLVSWHRFALSKHSLISLLHLFDRLSTLFGSVCH